MQVIIFEMNSFVSVVVPFTACGLSADEIGKKDVPASVPFWIVDDSTLPVDIPQDAWELDTEQMGTPAGYGGTYTPAEKSND
ncbi:hypothetical protein MUA02_21100 [Enterobacteriaceae bacterium H20N1]|uniref:Uncharacterized protein n=1 Tax=Dryocola boscaweniae TaxID=2925397 RepID=A0A9X2W608_9ENTR|nr:hypothetical protein [Dryocola boscaweniae]MCT4701236.1 hypothetical protein [Dryocola boscaweniae]MCT4721518.1 hypothetical protein [Dryocola boscaweniae]